MTHVLDPEQRVRPMIRVSEIVAQLLGERQGQDHLGLGTPSAFFLRSVFVLGGDPDSVRSVPRMDVSIWVNTITIKV